MESSDDSSSSSSSSDSTSSSEERMEVTNSPGVSSPIKIKENSNDSNLEDEHGTIEEDDDEDVIVMSDENPIENESKHDTNTDKKSTARRLMKNIPGERKSSRLKSTRITFCQKKHESALVKSLVVLLKKPTESLTEEEKNKLKKQPKLTKLAESRLEKRTLAIDRVKEIEDPPEELEEKCSLLADIIKNSKYLMIYTGAGISTSASIPDYRGPNGIWTLLQKGQSLDTHTNNNSLTTADPTITHMAIRELYKQGIVKHVVSQNCDGLHIRSGIPKQGLSEVHGNMYIEVCVKCNREYVRLFDVTEHSRRREHRTGRNCYYCMSPLKDSIVHFGEKGVIRWPLNWAGAEYHCNKVDTIICLGSSLKVLRSYPWLWSMWKPPSERPNLCIVNLQWTPKDQFARLKIHGRTDQVMTKVMEKLQIPIPTYHRSQDPIFSISTPLHPSELSTKSSVDLMVDTEVVATTTTNTVDLNNYIRFDSSIANEVTKLLKSDQNTASNIKKGNGSGWLGNAWNVKPKIKKKTQQQQQQQASNIQDS